MILKLDWIPFKFRTSKQKANEHQAAAFDIGETRTSDK